MGKQNEIKQVSKEGREEGREKEKEGWRVNERGRQCFIRNKDNIKKDDNVTRQ